jgi:hypothetical protein
MRMGGHMKRLLACLLILVGFLVAGCEEFEGGEEGEVHLGRASTRKWRRHAQSKFERGTRTLGAGTIRVPPSNHALSGVERVILTALFRVGRIVRSPADPVPDLLQARCACPSGGKEGNFG